ncbi:MAG: glycosyl hydrolase [Acidobacteria bacterium]|nr:glycosyl hydrolase [Acidobacteriota bacterium]
MNQNEESEQAVPTSAPEYAGVAPSFLRALQWRFIGPAHANRVSAVVGDPRDPLVFYFGGNGGGVFKTVDGGAWWLPVSDGGFKTGPVGALAVAESDPNVIYAGMGDTCMRPDMASGDGVYKSTDAGKSWTHMGLEETRHIGRILVHPRDANLVYVAAFGHAFGTNPERGVYRSKDGGKTWERVLFKSERAGAIDLAMDRTNPRVLYAAIYQFVRKPWDEVSGGPDSGLYKTTDGGDTWTELTAGLPTGIKGRIGVAVSPAKPSRVWAIVEAENGALFRSENGGASWERLNEQRDLRRSPSSYMHVYAHPTDPEKLYILSYSAWKSTDGGKSFSLWTTTHGDNHALWIDPRNPDRMIEGNDGGGTVTFNGGVSWSAQKNQAAAAVYRIAVDSQYPYRVYGTLQDGSSISLPSQTDDAVIGYEHAYRTAGGESGHIAVKPDDPNIVFAGAYGSAAGGIGILKKYDHRSRQDRLMSVWPEDTYSSHSLKDMKYRFNWTYPILFSPHDPDVLYVAGNVVFRSTDLGHSWTVISPDLTRNDTSVMVPVSGGLSSLGFAQTYTSVVFSLAESPIRPGELWAGSDDGLVHLSPDGGKTWANITPKDWPGWLRINTIDLSRHDAGTAYIAANRYLMDDQRPYLYKTTDYGRTWQAIANGIHPNAFARVIREDPARAGLLYAGTERGVYISFDAGASWQSLQLNLPGVAVHDLLVKDTDVVIGTHSRGFWILDDVTPLRQITDQVARSGAHLFSVTPAYRYLGRGESGGGAQGRDAFAYREGQVAFRDLENPDGGLKRIYANAGQNPPRGVVFTYYLKEKPTSEMKLTIKDETGGVIRRFSGEPASGEPRASAEPGTNRFVWDLRYPNARQLSPGAALSTIEWPRATAPVAPPGKYFVQLDIAGQIHEQAFEIRRDPRVLASAADLEAQFTLWIAARDKVSESTDAVNRLRDARKQVEDRARRAAQPGMKEAAEQIKARLATIEARLTRVVGPNPMQLPPKGVNQMLATLTEVIGSADAAPTRWTYSVFEELSARLAAQAKELDALIASDISHFLKRTETSAQNGR